MKKHILIALIISLSIIGVQQIQSFSSSQTQAAQTQVKTDEFVDNLLKASKSVNQALAEMQSGKFDAAYKTYDESIKYFDLAEKKLIATPNYKDRANLLNKTRASKATVYALKGKLEIEFYKQNAKGIVNLKKALELHPEKSAETLLTYATLAIQQGHNKIGEIYVNQVLSAKNIPAKYVSLAKDLKSRI